MAIRMLGSEILERLKKKQDVRFVALPGGEKNVVILTLEEASEKISKEDVFQVTGWTDEGTWRVFCKRNEKGMLLGC